MFVGHLGVGFVAGSADRRVPLWAWIGASFVPDLLWPLLLLAGVEQVRVDPGNTRFTGLAFDSYPWSHSLVLVLAWGAIAAVVAARATGARRTALLVGAVVVSHWGLDALAHRPDLPLWPGGPLAGLGLWDSVAATLAVEGALFACGIAAWLRVARPHGTAGRIAFWGLVALAGGAWLTQPWAPPPPSAAAVGVGGLANWLLPAWAWWIGRTAAYDAVRFAASRFAPVSRPSAAGDPP